MAVFHFPTRDTTEQFSELEGALRFSLQPVHPDPEFVGRLRDRLTTPKDTTLAPEHDPVDVAIFISGFVVGVVLLGFAITRLVMLLVRLLAAPDKPEG